MDSGDVLFFFASLPWLDRRETVTLGERDRRGAVSADAGRSVGGMVVRLGWGRAGRQEPP